MADTKLSALTADASPTTDDLIYVVNDPGGTPASRKVTIANLAVLLHASPTFTGAVTGASANFSATCSASDLHATGLVSGASANFSATCAAVTLAASGLVSGASASFTATCAAVTLVASGAVNGASANFTSTCSAAVLHSTGAIVAGGLFTGVDASFSATCSAAVIKATGSVLGASASFTATCAAVTLAASGLVSGASASFTATCAAVTLAASGLVSGASANFSATCAAAALSISGNIVNNSITYTAGAASQIGYQGLPVNSQTAAYEAIATDVGKVILHATSDNNARTFTIPSSATVAFAIGSVLTFMNLKNTVTIAITTDTMTLAGDTATGSRTLAVNGVATAIKLETGNWLISGIGLT